MGEALARPLWRQRRVGGKVIVSPVSEHVKNRGFLRSDSDDTMGKTVVCVPFGEPASSRSCDSLRLHLAPMTLSANLADRDQAQSGLR